MKGEGDIVIVPFINTLDQVVRMFSMDRGDRFVRNDDDPFENAVFNDRQVGYGVTGDLEKFGPVQSEFNA